MIARVAAEASAFGGNFDRPGWLRPLGSTITASAADAPMSACKWLKRRPERPGLRKRRLAVGEPKAHNPPVAANQGGQRDVWFRVGG